MATKAFGWRTTLAGVTGALMLAATGVQGHAEHGKGPESAVASFVDRANESVGKATLDQGPQGTVIRVRVSGLEPGYKAIHLHNSGDCSDFKAGFKASGSHVTADGNRMHGLLNGKGPEAGDLPNVYVHKDGTLRAELYTSRISIDGSVGPRLLDKDGSAMVIHESADNHKDQPIGGAGSRVACGIIEAS